MDLARQVELLSSTRPRKSTSADSAEGLIGPCFYLLYARANTSGSPPYLGTEFILHEKLTN